VVVWWGVVVCVWVCLLDLFYFILLFSLEDGEWSVHAARRNAVGSAPVAGSVGPQPLRPHLPAASARRQRPFPVEVNPPIMNHSLKIKDKSQD
jgi:hypothetical protein